MTRMTSRRHESPQPTAETSQQPPPVTMATDTDTSKRLPEDIGDREKERTEIQGQDQDRAHSSDGENSEQVRQQLKNTTIAPTMGNAAMVMEPDKGSREGSADAMATSSDPPGGETGEQKSDKAQEQGEPRGRLRRKRSIEEVEGVIGQDDAEKTGKQARKRSRDSESEAGQTRDAGDDVADASNTAMETERALPADASAVKETANGDLKIRPVTPDLNIGSDDKDSLLISPKNKRTRDQFLQESEKGAESDAMSQGKEKETAEENSKPAKRARDSSSPQPDTEPTAEKTEIRVETKVRLPRVCATCLECLLT